MPIKISVEDRVLGIPVYDKNGNLITSALVWENLLKDQDYKRVGSDEVRGFWISTVWLGLDHNFIQGGPPLYFETMIFPKGSMSELYCNRHASLKEAEEQHKLIVFHLKNGGKIEDL